MAWSPFDQPIVDVGSLHFRIPAGYTLDDRSTCRSCAAPIAWCTQKATGHKTPFNPDGTQHQTTCPHSDFWRERSRQRRKA